MRPPRPRPASLPAPLSQGRLPLRLAALLGLAGGAAGETIDHAGQYRACLALAARDAAAALGSAAAWHEQGGASGAEHCRAVALVQLERYDEAIALLTNIKERRTYRRSV